jgi:uncharacterized membrane protein
VVAPSARNDPMRIFGHPVHPMLVHFPVVFWTVAAGAYVAVALGTDGSIATIAKLANEAGLVMALLAMLAGALELRLIDSTSAAMQVAVWHMMIMAIVWFCFLAAIGLSVSTGLDRATAQLGEAACAGVGFVLMIVGAWFGARLIYQFGVAVTEPR